MEIREQSLLVLAALADGPRHGYAVSRAAEELSDGRVRLTAGTLYGALDRLIARGLVAVDREEVVSGRRRRYHRLTDEGRAALEAETARLAGLVGALRRVGRDDASRAAITSEGATA